MAGLTIRRASSKFALLIRRMVNHFYGNLARTMNHNTPLRLNIRNDLNGNVPSFESVYFLMTDCPLTLSRVKNVWHIMKNQNSSYFFVSLQMCGIFTWKYYFRLAKKLQIRYGPTGPESAKIKMPRIPFCKLRPV